MLEFFWSHTIWYFLLGSLTLSVAGYLFVKADNAKLLLGFGLALLGLEFMFETGILTLFNSYKYMPKLSGDPFLDSIIGNYFSQFSLAATALLFLVVKPPASGYLLTAALYCGIEQLFLKLGIYEHIWYRTWYTFVLVLLLLWIAKIWFAHLIYFPTRFVYYLTWFLAGSALFSVTVVFFMYAFKIQVFHFVVFPRDYYRNQAVFIVMYRTIIVLLMMMIFCGKWRWQWKGVMLVLIFGVHVILVKWGIQSYKNGFFYAAAVANIMGSYISVVLSAYWLDQGLRIKRTAD